MGSKGLAFKSPTPQTEDLYFKSINTTVDQYRAFLEPVRADTLVLPNCDFDTGNPTKAAEYSLTDDAYAKLLGQLSERKFDKTSPELRANVLLFYSDLSVQIETKKNPSDSNSVSVEGNSGMAQVDFEQSIDDHDAVLSYHRALLERRGYEVRLFAALVERRPQSALETITNLRSEALYFG